MSSVRQGGGAAASAVEDEIDIEAAAVDASFDEFELFVAGIVAVVGKRGTGGTADGLDGEFGVGRVSRIVDGLLHGDFSFSEYVIYLKQRHKKGCWQMGSDYEMSYKYKLKLLFLKDILERHTDADHGLTHAELTVKLREWGISANERTLRDDLVALQEYADRMGLELTDNIKIDEG